VSSSTAVQRPGSAAPQRCVRVDLAGLDGLVADNMGLFVCSDVRPLKGVAGLIDWRLCGALSAAVLNQHFSGDVGENLLMPVLGRFGPRRLFVFGLGPRQGCTVRTLIHACGQAVQVMQQAGAAQVVLAAPADAVAQTPGDAIFMDNVQEADPLPAAGLEAGFAQAVTMLWEQPGSPTIAQILRERL
jgi:hypothetical protein